MLGFLLHGMLLIAADSSALLALVPAPDIAIYNKNNDIYNNNNKKTNLKQNVFALEKYTYIKQRQPNYFLSTKTSAKSLPRETEKIN